MKLKNLIEGFITRLAQVEKRNSKLRDRVVEFIQPEKKKKKKRKDSLRDLKDTMKRTNRNIIGVSERKKGERDRSLFKEIMAKLGEK